MKFLQKIRKVASSHKKYVLAAVAVAVVGVAVPIVKAEFYPNRTPFDYNKPCNPNDNDKYDRCGSMTGPVFNSFINTPSYGDERAFFDGRRSDQAASGSYKNVVENVTEGSREVILRTYVHNNANKSTNASGLGVAKNTKVRIALPTAEEQVLRARSYISADNATPKLVEDTVDLTASEKFSLEYVAGSAVIYSNGPVNGQKLSDNIVTTGAPIGYSSLNGDLPGCFEYEAVIQIKVKVKVKEQPKLKIEKEVRKKGEKDWKETVSTKPGDQVEWLVTTQNNTSTAINNVVVRDVLPPHVQLVPGTVRIINVNQDETKPDAPFFQGGFNMGQYIPNGGGTYVIFSTKILDDFAKKECEVRVRNWALAKSDQTPEIKDSADVIIKREKCEKPPEPSKPKYSCDLLEVERGANRSAKFTTSASASGGATIERYRYNFGDGTEELITDRSVVEHTYTQDGSYVASVKVEVRVDGETKIAESQRCVVKVNFDTPPTPPEVPEQPGDYPGGPTTLVNTGPGDVVAIFVAVTLAGTVAYHIVATRRSLS